MVEDGLAPSTGGRAPRRLRFGADAGRLLVAELGGDSVAVGLADLSGQLLAQRDERADVMADPEGPLRRVEELFDALLADRGPGAPPVWGVGIGVLGPVDARSGSPLPLPPMPAWADYPIRKRFAGRYEVPVWVDNEVNLMALGEHRGGLGRGVDDLVFVKVGTGIGAGIITGGRLWRGARGSAGEVGHLRVTDDDSIFVGAAARAALWRWPAARPSPATRASLRAPGAARRWLAASSRAGPLLSRPGMSPTRPPAGIRPPRGC
ncbi:N-acetylmannosamine kinase [Streptomyces tendae]